MNDEDGQSQHTQWTASWIEQQREALRRQAQADRRGAPDEKVREPGAQATSPRNGQPFMPFKVGDELLAFWQASITAGASLQQGAVKAAADALDRVPAVGWARERMQGWRELLAAQSECQQLQQELRAVLLRVQGDALDLLEQRVRERAAANKPIASYRDLYNLWVECAEQIYAQVAHSDAYAHLQAQLGNATMRLRSRQQQILEDVLRQFDLPTRSELNSVHLQMRQLKARIAALEQAPAAARRRSPARTKVAKKTRGKKR